jgi:hypothetical protein
VAKPSAHNRIRLLNPLALLVVSGALGGLLWFNFQDEKVFAPGDREPDEVSLNYAQLLLAAHPEDWQLRVRLIEQLLQVGDYATARQHLLQWPQPDPIMQGFYLAQIDALSLPPGADPAPRLARLNALDGQQLSLAQLHSLAQAQLLLGSPASAAKTYAQLAERDAAQRQRWLLSQAQWALAANDPAQAASAYVALEQSNTDVPLKRQYLHQAFKHFVAANQGARAVALLMPRLATLDSDALALLEQGVDVAIAHQLNDNAQALLQQWHHVQPDNPLLPVKAFELHLAMQDLDGAWRSGRALVAATPDDLALTRRVAEVGEWVGAKAEALSLWSSLWQRTADEQSRGHAWRLAVSLGEWPQAVSLLAPIGDARPLSTAELDALLYAYAASQRQPDAEIWLRAYIQRHPEHREAWQALLVNLQDRHLDAAQQQVWAQLERRLGLTPVQRVAWAEAALRDQDPEAAWQALQTDTRNIDDVRFWRSRATVAWARKDQEHLHQALERLLALEGHLNAGDRSALVDYYRQRDPAQALRLAVQGWQQAPSRDSLALALQLALEQADWLLLQQLLESAAQHPELPAQLLQVLAQAALAKHNAQPEQAERVYRAGLMQFPESNLLREHLLWLYLDQRNLAALAPLVDEWRDAALADAQLWLPMASAQSALGNRRAALAWYRLAARQQPQNWLAQAAYADALEAAGYSDSAWRWRRALLRQPTVPTPSCVSCLQTWLRLLSASVSPAQAQRQAWQWQDGSPAMLQLWFDQLLANLSASGANSERDAWLEWARQRGLNVDDREALQQTLRGAAQSQLQALLAHQELSAGQRADILARLGRPGEARKVNVQAWAAAQSPLAEQALRNQAVQLEAAHPQGAQASWTQQDFGGLRIDGPALQLAGLLGDQWYADLKLSEGRYQGDALAPSVLGRERNLLAAVERGVANGRHSLIVDSSQRDDHSRNGLGLSRTWTVAPGQQLQAGLDWHRQSDETGMMRTFGQRDQVYAAGRHALTGRDELSWRLSQRRFSTRDDQSLGNGQALNLMLTHVLEAASPNWAVRGGLDYQRNQLSNRSLSGIASDEGGALELDRFNPVRQDRITAGDLLQERYGQVFIGSTWRRGSPGNLGRTSPQYTWLLDTNAGWQWQDHTFNYGVAAGIGFSVLGGDELAVKLGYQSAPQGAGGKAGGVLNISYSVRLGN